MLVAESQNDNGQRLQIPCNLRTHLASICHVFPSNKVHISVGMCDSTHFYF